ncbi:hypothetical protein CLAFUW4_04832 [Fulvia fulva]|uniref:DUF7624 domain-containing protein n=1 Tax=Passalora fulva TaxID=5499 RepID=A0A9Q8UUE0_PASFU|nr:uncharacterized protein CLAFUR5_12072 [Fulvia fulva]KAK4626932.1 hypothetical protein CLAFUR4_04818 [Fulvia fulva]KAK4627567.1 hypothetical protein CLAFUR0_04822 [Fulvia fulva]UJO22692.1 hypothetical protein CLAFUR5_12072 [Fulvia fulva]WPV14179.1 hypothetical protein CLAFUW4_04832 [Fulvia fulva]WPV29141.1 hypothetical protein CLAFUW7_04826 [Fulvia fulva]
MALKSPLMPSPTGGGLDSAFSPYSDSPNSPARFNNTFQNGDHTRSNRSSGTNDNLAPPASPYPQQIEPSPVDSTTSNGTESTEIDEDAQEEGVKSPGLETNSEAFDVQSPDLEITSPESAKSDIPHKLDTHLPPRHRSDSADNDPQSVIHAPSGFHDFKDGATTHESPVELQHTARVASPSTPEAAVVGPGDKKPVTSPVNTNVPQYTDRSTPRAQTRQELDDDYKRRSRRTSSLEDIPEALDKDTDDDRNTSHEDERPNTAELVGEGSMQQAMDVLNQVEDEVAALRTALSECWTLCNTLANLSSSHRQRTFKFSGKTEVQEQAWRSCWKLCQQLYEHRDDDHTAQVLPTLELCRDFCQSLFDARQKMDEASDSVLRVSFELNNHLYNTHDRELPDAFNERTLDFYITLCHRLMKQRTSLPQETDSLLRACWQLAENLFNLRQSSREGRSPDEELLGSAVQACWELCDLFREGWTQIRPERATPRPNQTTFGSQSSFKSGSTRSAGRSTSSTISNRKYHEAQTFPPETPVTVFDDASTANSSPDSISVPNILVLGPASTGSNNSVRGAPHHERWSSNASVLSDYSESAASSQRSSSTATAGAEEAQLGRLRCLLLKAGMTTGYSRGSGQQLPIYVKALPDTAFGTLPWQMKVLTFYKKLVTNDKSMYSVHQVPSRRLGAAGIAKAVRWLGNSEQWAWMRDLFRIVFGFGIDEADRRGGSFQI